jgi:hypothetical protein
MLRGRHAADLGRVRIGTTCKLKTDLLKPTALWPRSVEAKVMTRMWMSSGFRLDGSKRKGSHRNDSRKMSALRRLAKAGYVRTHCGSRPKGWRGPRVGDALFRLGILSVGLHPMAAPGMAIVTNCDPK